MHYLNHAVAFSPEILVVLYAFLVLMRGVFGKDKEDVLKGMVRQSLIFGGLFLLIFATPFSGDYFGYIKTDLYDKDGFSTILSIMILLSVAPWFFIGGLQRVGADVMDFEYYALLAFSVLGMLVMVSASNLMTMYIGIELQALPLYAIIGMRRSVPRAGESAIKYFILGAMASGFLLYGAALVYGATNATDFDTIYNAFAQEGVFENTFSIGLIFILGGMFFKLSAAPFHVWAPDVYSGASNVQVGILSLAPKIAALGLLARLIYGPFANLAGMWEIIFLIVITISLFIGAFGALWQTDVRRLLAYSGIGHMGFMLMGLLGGFYNVTSVLLYITTYIVTMVPFLWVVSHMYQEGQEATNTSVFKGLGRTHPLLGLVLATSLFSMAGIPPLAGFFGKFYVLMAAIDSGFIWLSIFAVLMSVVSAFYYLRLIKFMYFDEGEGVVNLKIEPFTCSIFILLIVTFGWYQQMLEPLFEKAVLAFSSVT